MKYSYYERQKSKQIFAAMKQRAFVAACLVSGLLVGLSVAVTNAGGLKDNKDIVTGTTPPCATMTIGKQTISPFTKDEPEGVRYYLPALTIKGSITNCSTSLQAYYIEFSEVSRGVQDILGQDVCALQFGAGVGDFLMKSGSSKGWTLTQDISLAGMSDITNCVGEHQITARLIDRTSGAVMQEVSSTYSVVLK